MYSQISNDGLSRGHIKRASKVSKDFKVPEINHESQDSHNNNEWGFFNYLGAVVVLSAIVLGFIYYVQFLSIFMGAK